MGGDSDDEEDSDEEPGAGADLGDLDKEEVDDGQKKEEAEWFCQKIQVFSFLGLDKRRPYNLSGLISVFGSPSILPPLLEEVVKAPIVKLENFDGPEDGILNPPPRWNPCVSTCLSFEGLQVAYPFTTTSCPEFFEFLPTDDLLRGLEKVWLDRLRRCILFELTFQTIVCLGD